MAAGAPRIFVSHLSGVAVFDPNGDQVGRVRDLVAMLRVGRRPPRLLGLVVELSTRRRIFLPMTRVTGIESGQVITTGVLNVRRFEQRPTERLVFGELLDRRVTLVETDEEVTVLDVSIQQLPARRDWEIDRVFVRKGRSGAVPARQGRDADRRVVRRHRVLAGGARDRAPRASSPPSSSCARPTSRTSCTTCPRNGAGRSPPPWTTTASPTSSKSSPRTTRSRSSASSRRSAPPTSWRRWTRTTRPTCSPSCPRTTWSGC